MDGSDASKCIKVLPSLPKPMEKITKGHIQSTMECVAFCGELIYNAMQLQPFCSDLVDPCYYADIKRSDIKCRDEFKC